ncbi:helix-turn-helix domain-containing protein [Flagellimonas aequoris]|uniref:Helix-turn-helix domain-containing protein n=1 Tax=Flagellimonas aequoris TaxID=2306997 RepID=A0A418N4L4_9FLAO|nr:helix-turn-helix domain-containing protein [Allomuricauda aequoris]TXK00517.1 helix-turn-helix domain-containing protein [Allomuricauda aequoris]
MVNEEIVSRIQAVIDYHNLTVSAFADRIGVQRSSISHLLSGRNKPSLDFVMKLVHAFPDVNLYWLLKGEGNFPSDPDAPALGPSKHLDVDTEPAQPIQTELPSPVTRNIEMKKEPFKIVIFYPDGTFESFHPKND